MSAKLLKVDNIMYRVKDLQLAEEFYTQVLGLTKVWADTERSQIGFKLANHDNEIVIHQDDSLPDFDYSYLVENVSDFIRETQLVPVFGPIEVRCGKYAVIEDPDGNKLPIIDLTKFEGKPKYD